MSLARVPTVHVDEEHADQPRHGMRAYLPHSTDEGAISTRGQALPALLHSLSSNSTPRRTSSWRYLTDLGKSHVDESPKKQTATSMRSQRRYSNSSNEDDEGISFGRRPSTLDRRQSNAAVTLMTQEMRSQRLIGNSNPRYRW
jgi:hypothetical protein